MNLDKIKRREFLKIMGWGGAGATLVGCDMPTTVTLEEGKEEVVSYLAPEEYVIPGIGVWYASTCQQCSAACGIHGRVREGRVLKLEGNPASSVNAGKLCQMGQAGLQGHYNPDRITTPLVRKGGVLTPISWDEALALLNEKTGAKSGLDGKRVAWVTGAMSGHQSVLLNAHLTSLGSDQHFVQEIVNDAVWRAVCKDMLGDSNPRLRLDKASVVLSFGADFLGTWGSPVHFATEYSKFRNSPRGTLIQVEPKMTLTGANADLWLPCKTGTEGVLALGIAHELMQAHGLDNLPAQFKSLIMAYNLTRVADETGLSAEHIRRAAKLLKQRGPSLVLAGASAQGHEHGYQSVAAAMMLNIMLGNVGKTIEAGTELPFDGMMSANTGGSRDIAALAEAMGNDAFDVVFFAGANPAYTAPDALKMTEGLSKVGFKVALSMFEDETTVRADLVLPLASALEDWGTHVSPVQTGTAEISIQQPLMEKIYPETRGFGDILLALLKLRKSNAYSGFDDYYAYLKQAVNNMPAGSKKTTSGDDWAAAMQSGLLAVNGRTGKLTPRSISIEMPKTVTNAQYPMHLIPSARLGLWDGRHANLPWLQEAPDQITKVVWDSWAEIHPKTAARLGLKMGDSIKITSSQGSIEAKVYIYKGIQIDAVAVPLGQGHVGYGRYANGLGVNPLKIIDPITDKKTGELALFATRVAISPVAGKADDKLVRLGGSETQVGRKLVATIKADVFERTEGGA